MVSTQQTTWRGALIVAAALILLTGCARAEDGEFTLSGFEQHQECLAGVSPLRPEMFAARDSIDAVSVSMQTDFRLPSTSDFVHIVVYQPDVVRERLGEPIELAEPLELVQDDEEFDEAPIVRAQIAFSETCPEIQETLGLRGTVIFDELDADRDGRVSGQLIDAQAVSLRNERVVVTQVEGFWDFDVRQHRPYKFFPDYGDDPTRGPVP